MGERWDTRRICKGWISDRVERGVVSGVRGKLAAESVSWGILGDVRVHEGH